MDVGSNKTRKDSRAVVSLVARYRSPSTFEYVEEACCDVSLGGMFIRSADPAAAGTLLKLECETGTGAKIRGVARVVWLRGEHSEYGPSGMGVKFVKLDADSRDVITRIVQELAAAGIEAPSMSSAPETRDKPATTPAPSTPSPKSAAATTTPLPAERTPTSTEPQNASSGPAQAAQTQDATTAQPPSAATGSAIVADTDAAAKSSAPDAANPLAPLAPLERSVDRSVERSARPSSSFPSSPSSLSPQAPSEKMHGRAFWMVAAAVLALGVLITLFADHASREATTELAPTPAESPAVQPSRAREAMGTSSHAGAEPLTQTPNAAPATPSATRTDHSAARPSTAHDGTLASETTASAHPPVTPQEATPQEAPSTATPPQRPVASPERTAQDVSRTTPEPSPADTKEAAAAAESIKNPRPSGAATTSTKTEPPVAPEAHATSTQANQMQHELGPSERSHVIAFTSRPSGATITVEDHSVVTPAQVDLGRMPTKVRVTAEKEGFESSSAWINNVDEFEQVGDAMRRNVHMVLHPLPTPSTTPASNPSPAPAAANTTP